MKTTRILLAALLLPVFIAQAGSTEERMKSIIIPELDLKQAPVSAVIELLRQRLGEGDDPINIILKHSNPASLPKMTLSMRKVSTYDILRYTCEISGLSFRFDGNTVIVYPRTR